MEQFSRSLSKFCINLRVKLNNLKRWFSYFKTITNVVDFDYESVLELEYKQLLRLKKCMENPEGWEYEGLQYDLQKLNTTIKLLDIILKEEPNDYVNIRNGKRFLKDAELNIKIIQDILYLRKCWELYHKMRITYMKHWWI